MIDQCIGQASCPPLRAYFRENKGGSQPPSNFQACGKKKYMEKVKKNFCLRRNKGAVSWVSTDTVNLPPLHSTSEKTYLQCLVKAVCARFAKCQAQGCYTQLKLYVNPGIISQKHFPVGHLIKRSIYIFQRQQPKCMACKILPPLIMDHP